MATAYAILLLAFVAICAASMALRSRNCAKCGARLNGMPIKHHNGMCWYCSCQEEVNQ